MNSKRNLTCIIPSRLNTFDFFNFWKRAQMKNKKINILKRYLSYYF